MYKHFRKAIVPYQIGCGLSTNPITCALQSLNPARLLGPTT